MKYFLIVTNDLVIWFVTRLLTTSILFVLLPLNTFCLRVFYTVDYTSIVYIFLYYNIHVKNVSWQHSCMKENGKGHMNFLFSVFYAWQTIKNTCHTVCSVGSMQCFQLFFFFSNVNH